MRDRVDRICRVLTEDLGLVPGNRVLLRGGNSIGMALAWLAVVKAGLIAVATMPLLRARGTGRHHRQGPAHRRAVRRQAAGGAGAGARGPSRARHGRRLQCGSNEPGSLAARAAAKSGDFPACPTAADDIAMMAFTSGTTGKPKAAVHTHRDVLAPCEAWPRHVLRAHARRHRGGFAAAGLHLRPGRPAGVPDVGRRLRVFPRRAATRPRALVRTDQRSRRDHLLHGAHLLPPDGAVRARARRGQACASASAPARACPMPRASYGSRPPASRCSTASARTEMFHIFISAAGDEVRPGAVGKVGAGLHGQGGRRRRPAKCRAGTIGKLAVIGPTGCKLPGRPAPGQLREGRLELPRRCLHAGRGRLLLLPGARRRHDHHRRLQRGRPGGRRRAAAGTRRLPSAA